MIARGRWIERRELVERRAVGYAGAMAPYHSFLRLIEKGSFFAEAEAILAEGSSDVLGESAVYLAMACFTLPQEDPEVESVAG